MSSGGIEISDMDIHGDVISARHESADDNANITADILESEHKNECNDNEEAVSEDSGMSSVDNRTSDLGGPMLVMPTSPVSVTTTSMSASDDMIENENEMMRDRVADLEKKVHDQNDEITCLRATLADCLRRINNLESNKSHVQLSNLQQPRLRTRTSGDQSGHGGRRPISGSYSSQDFGNQINHGSNHHEAVNRRASYASNRDKLEKLGSSKQNLYQSTTSLHTAETGRSSNSMSPAPHTPSPTTPSGHRGAISPATHRQSPHTPNRPLSAVGGLTKKWSSTSDFRDLSPGPGSHVSGSRSRVTSGSMASLRSPFGSQQNLNRSQMRHVNKEPQFSADEGLVRLFLRGRPINLLCPSAYLENYSLAKVNPAPPQKLKLEWVYGYRGRDARSNLHLLPTGEMVYFVAAVVVLYNVEEQTQRHYLGHTQDIKAISIHPNKLLIASGQGSGSVDRPHVRIWNSVSLQTLHILGVGDFERPICCLSFSKADGGNLLVIVDDVEHNISVWDWARGERGHKITETKCSTDTVVAAEFHPLEGKTIITVGKGFVNFWQLDPTSFTLSRKTGIFDTRDKPKYVTCLAFSSTGDVITGDSNGNVFIWGRGYNAVTKVMRKVHDGPIFSICVLKDGSIITGGGKDCRIVKFDTLYRKTGLEAQLPEHLGSIRTLSQGKGSQLLLGTTKNTILTGNFELNFQEIMMGHVSEVWALASSPSAPQFISAGHDRMIYLWDTLTHSVVWSNDVGEQAQSATFSPDGEVIVVGTVTGKWVVLHASTRAVYGVHQDGTEPVHVVKFSPDGSFLALGSRDNAIYIYQVKDNYRKFARTGRCLGHSGQVTQLDWSTDSQFLQSNSGPESEILHWAVPSCRPLRDMDLVRDLTWASGDCPVSWNTLGLLSDEEEMIVSASTCFPRDLLVGGDTGGRLKLFANPASQPKCLSHLYNGHSSPVSRLAWVSDGTRLLSAGGKDTAILQWSVTGVERPGARAAPE